MGSLSPRLRRVLPALLLVVLALLAVAPLLVRGVSCGHDFEFHLQSWLDAAAQMRHGIVDPAWTVSAAWNAGEPRFLFYPPLSWMLGAVLALTMPLTAVPAAFTFLALLGAGAAMYLLARDYAGAPVASIAAALYIASPYMLFTAFERTAYGELLAAAWMPLLLRAALRRRPSVLGLAVPTALLWLSNAPAAVTGMYLLLLIGVVRLVQAGLRRARAELWRMAVSFSAGGALGLALAAFYLLPAAYERRYVQVAMAIIPNMRVEDNFLFGHTGDAPHDRVLHTASVIAVVMLLAAVGALAASFLQMKEAAAAERRASVVSVRWVLIVVTVAIAFLLTPVSLPLWHHVPELAFLQFPWRLLSVVGLVFALAMALALRGVRSTTETFALPSVGAAIFVTAMAAGQMRTFRQGCEVLDRPSARAQLFATHHGVEPTDEYTPTDADNDVLRWDDPGYWVAANADQFAPETVANPAATIVNYDTPPPVGQTVSGVAPRHLELKLGAPAVLILNLRDYPAWRVFRNGELVTLHLQRDDGLLAIALPQGASSIDVRWHRTWDQWVGDVVSVLALLVMAMMLARSRTIRPDA
jgi:hypothetical protein